MQRSLRPATPADAFEAWRSTVPVVRPAPRAEPPRSPMSGRRLRTFRDSVLELEFLMLEGDPHPDGGVYGRWGIQVHPEASS